MILGKRADYVTNLAGVTATSTGAWVPCAGATDINVVLGAASVTTGCVLVVEGNTKNDGTGTTFLISSSTVNSNTPAPVAVAAASVPAAIRTRVSTYTDGTHTTLIGQRVV